MNASLQRIVALATKELLAVLKDKRSRIVLIVPPLLQLLVFGYAATFDLNDVPVAIYNEDRGALSRELVARITGWPLTRTRTAGCIQRTVTQGCGFGPGAVKVQPATV